MITTRIPLRTLLLLLLTLILLTIPCVALAENNATALSAAFASNPGEMYAVDLGKDGSLETLHVYPSVYSDSKSIMLAVYDTTGVLIDVFELAYSNFPADFDDYYHTLLEMYILDSGKLYVEYRLQFEGVSTDYMLLAPYVEGMYIEKHISDPGYSDGYGLNNALDGSELYFTENMGEDVTTGVSIMNKFFEGDGLVYAPRTLPIGDYTIDCCSAQPGEERLICRLTDFERMTVFSTIDFNALPVVGENITESWFIATPEPVERPTPVPVERPTPEPIARPTPEPVVRPTPEPVTSKYVRTTGDINVRALPDKTSTILGTLGKGSTATYLGEESRDYRGVIWYKIDYKGNIGWVSSVYSELSNSGSPSTSKPSSSSSSSSGNATGQRVTAVDGNLNVRTGPGLSYKDIGTIKEGNSASYLGKSSVDERGATWYYVNFNGKKGWVSSKWGKLR